MSHCRVIVDQCLWKSTSVGVFPTRRVGNGSGVVVGVVREGQKQSWGDRIQSLGLFTQLTITITVDRPSTTYYYYVLLLRITTTYYYYILLLCSATVYNYFVLLLCTTTLCTTTLCTTTPCTTNLCTTTLYITTVYYNYVVLLSTTTMYYQQGESQCCYA